MTEDDVIKTPFMLRSKSCYVLRSKRHVLRSCYVKKRDNCALENSFCMFAYITVCEYKIFKIWVLCFISYQTSSTFLVNGDAYILPYRLHTYLGLNSNGSP